MVLLSKVVNLQFELVIFCSFDIVRDTLGLVRTEFPHTIYFVAGTQVSLTSQKPLKMFPSC